MDWTAGLTGIMGGINQGIDTSEKIKNSWRADDERKLKEEEFNAKMAPVADYKTRPEYQVLDAAGKQRIDAQLAGKPVRALDLKNVFDTEVGSANTANTLRDFNYKNKPIDVSTHPDFQFYDKATQEHFKNNIKTQYDLDKYMDMATKNTDFLIKKTGADKLKAETLYKQAAAKLTTTTDPNEKATLQQSMTEYEKLFTNADMTQKKVELDKYFEKNPAERSKYIGIPLEETYKMIAAERLQILKNKGEVDKYTALRPTKDPQEEKNVKMFMGMGYQEPNARRYAALMKDNPLLLPKDVQTRMDNLEKRGDSAPAAIPVEKPGFFSGLFSSGAKETQPVAVNNGVFSDVDAVAKRERDYQAQLKRIGNPINQQAPVDPRIAQEFSQRGLLLNDQILKLVQAGRKPFVKDGKYFIYNGVDTFEIPKQNEGM